MKNLFILLFTTLFINPLFSQSALPFVIASSGGYYSGSSFTVSYTVAEMSAVETFSSPSIILTQGFQQPENLYTLIKEISAIDPDIHIYPNPVAVSEKIRFAWRLAGDSKVNVDVYDVAGRLISTTLFENPSGLTEHILDPPGKQGMYILYIRFVSANRKILSSIHKINVLY
jgi:hypothetical protein